MSTWERLALFEGGAVPALATATAADGARHVFAATTVGVFISKDRGLRWSPLGGASRVPGVEAVAASPRYAEDGMVYAGAYDGLFRWHEGGAVWEHLLSGSRVLSVAVAAGEGASVTVLAGTETDGILISRDGGRSWEGANAGLLDLEILALVASPDVARDGLAYAATPTTLYRTRNGAESWRELDLDWDDIAIQCLAISPAFTEDRVILAGAENHGMLRSKDAGRTWEPSPDLADRMVNSLSISGAGRVVAGTDAGVALSDDAGQSWRIVGEELGGVGGAALVRDGDEMMLLAGLAEPGVPRAPGFPHTGIARSVDDGHTWVASNVGLAARLLVKLRVSPTGAGDQTICVTSLDAGDHVSSDGGVTWAEQDGSTDDDAPLESVPLPFERAEIVALARLPQDAGGGTIIAATSGSASRGGGAETVVWRTTDRGRRWDRWFEEPWVPGIGVSIVALPANPWDDTVVLAYGGRVYRPRPNAWENRGGARRPVWDAAKLPGQDKAGRQPAITGLVASPAYAQDRTLFAATSAGVYVSRDGGASFTRWSDGLEPSATVAVAASPAYARDRLVYALGLGGMVWRRQDTDA